MKAKVEIQEDHCPMCGGSLNYYGKDWHDNQFCQEVECIACQFGFQQWYTLRFDGMTTYSKMDGQPREDIEEKETP